MHLARGQFKSTTSALMQLSEPLKRLHGSTSSWERHFGKVWIQTCSNFPLSSQLLNSSRVDGGTPTNQWMGRAEAAHIEVRLILHLVSFCLTLLEHVLLTSTFVWLNRREWIAMSSSSGATLLFSARVFLVTRSQVTFDDSCRCHL